MQRPQSRERSRSRSPRQTPEPASLAQLERVADQVATAAELILAMQPQIDMVNDAVGNVVQMLVQQRRMLNELHLRVAQLEAARCVPGTPPDN